MQSIIQYIERKRSITKKVKTRGSIKQRKKKERDGKSQYAWIVPQYKVHTGILLCVIRSTHYSSNERMYCPELIGWKFKFVRFWKWEHIFMCLLFFSIIILIIKFCVTTNQNFLYKTLLYKFYYINTYINYCNIFF